MSDFVRWEEIKERLPQRSYSAEDVIRFAMGVSLTWVAEKPGDLSDGLIEDCTQFTIRVLSAQGFSIVERYSDE